MASVELTETLTVLKPLRVCNVCGLKAHTEGDLNLFSNDARMRYGRQNICKACDNAARRKGGRWYESMKRLHERWDPRRIRHKGKSILLKFNPRGNICLSCGLKYPETYGKQTCVHHWIPGLPDPLAWTRELCASCHAILEAVIRKVMRGN